jgi:hypothetical protein
MRIAELKQQCSRPEVVEIWDVTATDPTLLVELKAARNTVPVPRHWCQKRKFLQGKRGIEKPPWQLPEFIEATGISTMRQVCGTEAATHCVRRINAGCIRTGIDCVYDVSLPACAACSPCTRCMMHAG